MAQQNSTKVYAGGKVVGQVRGDTLHKTIRARHYLRKPPAIAFDVAVLEQAERAGAHFVEVRDADTGTIFRTTIHHIHERGFTLNRGYGEQIALPVNGWTATRRGEGLQLALFRVGGAA